LGSSSSCWFFRKRLASSRALNTVIISKTSLAKSSSKGRILALVQGSWFGAETQQVVFVRKHKAIHRIIQNASNQALQSLVYDHSCRSRDRPPHQTSGPAERSKAQAVASAAPNPASGRSCADTSAEATLLRLAANSGPEQFGSQPGKVAAPMCCRRVFSRPACLPPAACQRRRVGMDTPNTSAASLMPTMAQPALVRDPQRLRVAKILN
jgi:hypothetical protein